MTLPLLIPALFSAGCATQQQDGQSASLAHQIEVMRQQQTQLASDVSSLRGRMDAVEAATARNTQAVAKANETAEDAIKIARDSRSVSGKVVESLVLGEDMVSYSYEHPELTASGKAALDELIQRVRPLMPHAFIEIIGFTDDASLGSQNRKNALERAESVRRYLREAGDVPLHRMSSISYGDLQPLNSNTTAQSRSQNRRVVVQVLK